MTVNANKLFRLLLSSFWSELYEIYMVVAYKLRLYNLKFQSNCCFDRDSTSFTFTKQLYFASTADWWSGRWKASLAGICGDFVQYCGQHHRRCACLCRNCSLPRFIHGKFTFMLVCLVHSPRPSVLLCVLYHWLIMHWIIDTLLTCWFYLLYYMLFLYFYYITIICFNRSLCYTVSYYNYNSVCLYYSYLYSLELSPSSLTVRSFSCWSVLEL